MWIVDLNYKLSQDIVMKRKLTAALLSATVLLGGLSLRAQNQTTDSYRHALDLYEHGMFERAGTIFDQISLSTGDVMAEGYRTLCAVRLQEKGYETMVANYIGAHPYSKLVPQIRFYNGLNLFDREDYSAAVGEFDLIEPKHLGKSQVAEYMFKHGYALFEEGDLDRARDIFAKGEKMPYSDYTAPSRYSMGYIDYTRKDFKEAYNWFEKAGKDARFTDISNYYMTECRFMQKDYAYVLKNGVKLYDEVPADRKSHLARIISESYLATGDSGKAKEFYDKIESDRIDMDRDDWFYAGTVLYSNGDFKGAIDNFSRMSSRTDSIGQIANYQLGYSYIQTGNKVAALDAFRDASSLGFNPDIQEDAHFNYAKLSFDLNHNPKVFDDYISKYPGKDKGDQIYSYMALASLYNHDYAGAVDAYANIDNLDNNQKANYMRANYLRANQLIGNGSWRDAVPLLKAAGYYSDKREPFNQLTRYWLGESYYRGDQYDKAVETFQELYNNSALDGKPEGRLIPYDLAYSYFRMGDYDNAAKWFDEYLQEKNPSEGEDAASRRADCDFIKKDYKTAVKGYEDAMRRFDYSSSLYPAYKAGIAYGLLGDKKGKVDVLSRALRYNPSAGYYSEAMYELGRAYVASGNNDAAIKAFDKLRVNTDDKTIAARALIELGMIYRNMSEYDKALGYYKRVVEDMPGTEYASDALAAIESIYQTDGRTDEFIDYADKIGAIKDKSAGEKESMYFAAAEQLYLSENWNKALASLQNYLERYPSGADAGKAVFYTAECYRNLGKKEQACDWYKKAVQGGAGSSYTEAAMLNFSRLSYEMQRYKDAYGGFSSLLGAAKIEGNKHTARVGMTRSAYKGGDFTAAISCADKVKADSKSTEAELREADYIKAKSLLSTNERSRAFEIFNTLAAKPSTNEGAEAAYMLILDAYDQGKYDTVEKKVYDFSSKAAGQNYWLAKSFIVLGDSFADQDNFAQAKATFESVLNGYQPTGTEDDVLDNVRMRLSKLNNLMK